MPPLLLRLVVVGSVVGLACGAVLLHQVDPTTSRVLPDCVFHALTSLHCPGCGSTRALHALLHGDIAAAVRFNPLTLPAVAFLGYAYVRWAVGALAGRRGEHVGARIKPWLLLALAVVICVFWITRNIPVFPLTLLTPPVSSP